MQCLLSLPYFKKRSINKRDYCFFLENKGVLWITSQSQLFRKWKNYHTTRSRKLVWLPIDAMYLGSTTHSYWCKDFIGIERGTVTSEAGIQSHLRSALFWCSFDVAIKPFDTAANEFIFYLHLGHRDRQRNYRVYLSWYVCKIYQCVGEGKAWRSLHSDPVLRYEIYSSELLDKLICWERETQMFHFPRESR